MVARHATFPIDRGLARWPHLFEMVLLATMVVCALVLAVATLGSRRARTAAAVPVAAIEAPTTAPTSELPREWRWERAPITFDHMYRSEARQAGGDASRLRVASRAQSPIPAKTARFAKRRGANAGGP